MPYVTQAKLVEQHRQASPDDRFTRLRRVPLAGAEGRGKEAAEVSDRFYPEMEGMSEEQQERYLRAVERVERRTLRAVTPMLAAVYEAADGRDRHKLVSALERFLFWLTPLLEAYLPEARAGLAEDIGRATKPPRGKPGEVVRVPLSQLRAPAWVRWIDAVFPDESGDQ